jgi:hypothetical protein
MVSADEIAALMEEVLLGTPSGLVGPEYDAHREAIRKEAAEAEKLGQIMEVPYD